MKLAAIPLVAALCSCVPDGECRFSDLEVGTYFSDVGARHHPRVAGSVRCAGEPAGTYASVRLYGDSVHSLLVSESMEYVGGVGEYAKKPARDFELIDFEVVLDFDSKIDVTSYRKTVPMVCAEFRADTSNVESWKRVGCALAGD